AGAIVLCALSKRCPALAQAGDHRFAAGLDTFGDRDLALARQQLHRAHFAQIHAHRIIRALGRLLGLGLSRDLCWTSTSSPLSLSASSSGSSPSSRSPSLLVSSVSTTLTPISLNMASTSSICSELTSSEGNTELIWS